MATVGISSRLKRGFTENLPLKALSLLIAIILWTVVSGEKNEEWSYLVPLDIVDQPEELIITNNVPGFLDLRLRGSHNFIKGLNPKDMAVKIDISNGTPGSNIYPITADLINTPRGATVTRINPSYITLELEKLVKKQVSLKTDLIGNPPAGFFVESVTITPSSIEISGAKSELKTIRQLKTVNVDISGESKDILKTVPVDISGKKIKLAQNEPVSVKVTIKEVLEKLEIKKIVPKAINLDPRYKVSLSPELMHILVEGPKSIVSALKETGVDITVDAVDLRAGNHKRPAKVNLPDGVKLLYSYPKEINLKVARR
ncbi:MAG: CdaR family protein [bacterium]|nr:CdaR family protein [bacterium]